MLQPTDDWRELGAPDDSFPPPQPEPDWKAIAEELINAKDEKKVRELSLRLIYALEKDRGTS